MKNISSLMTMLGSVLFLSSCDKCDDGIVCTDEFRMIMINAETMQGVPVALDSAYTLRHNSLQRLFFDQTMSSNGTYVVLDDSYHPNLKNQQDSFRFIGKMGNNIVVDKSYVIAGDNCHIFKKSGPDEVVVP